MVLFVVLVFFSACLIAGVVISIGKWNKVKLRYFRPPFRKLLQMMETCECI